MARAPMQPSQMVYQFLARNLGTTADFHRIRLEAGFLNWKTLRDYTKMMDARMDKWCSASYYNGQTGGVLADRLASRWFEYLQIGAPDLSPSQIAAAPATTATPTFTPMFNPIPDPTVVGVDMAEDSDELGFVPLDNEENEENMNEENEVSVSEVACEDLASYDAAMAEYEKQKAEYDAKAAAVKSAEQQNAQRAAYRADVINRLEQCLTPTNPSNTITLSTSNMVKAIKNHNAELADRISEALLDNAWDNIRAESGTIADILAYAYKLTEVPVEELPPAPAKPVKPKVKPSFTPCNVDGAIVPTHEPTFVVKPDTASLFEAVVERAMKGVPPNILLTGPAGCGKTELAKEFAVMVDLPLLKINCPMVREPRDWFGYKTVVNGDIEWIQTQFAQAVSQGGVVVLFDEISRVSPYVLNSLMPLMDSFRSTFIEELKETLHCGPGVFFIATANIGGEYTGVSKIDKALQDRFGITIECTYLKENDEAKLLQRRCGVNKDVAARLAKFAATVRAQSVSAGPDGVSTRAMIETAKLYASIGADAFQYTVLPRYHGDDRQTVVTALQAQFGTELNK